MLNVLTREEAVSLIKEKTADIILETEKVNISEALGRILAQDIISSESIPAFDRTTVDGYAVIAADTFGAGASMPAQLDIIGEILMGEEADFTLKSGQCARISTGGMLPKGADAAVMVEHADNADGLCLIYKSVAPYENVMTLPSAKPHCREEQKSHLPQSVCLPHSVFTTCLYIKSRCLPLFQQATKLSGAI